MNLIFNEPTPPKNNPEHKVHNRPPLSYYFRPDRWKAWWLGKKTNWANKIIEENKTLHPDNATATDEKAGLDLITYSEQFVYRTTRCECYDKGQCKCCGCPANEKMMQANETCKWGMWGPMLSRKAWITKKIKEGIKFKT